MNKLYLFCLLLFGGGLSLCAQPLDTLYAEYERAKARGISAWAERAEWLGRIVDAESHKNLEKALLQMDTLASHYFWLGDLDKHYHADLQRRGVAYAAARQFVPALKYYEEYARVANLQDGGKGYFFIEAGNLCYTVKLMSIARRYYEQAEAIFEKERHYAGLSTVYGNYSLIALAEKKIDTALMQAQKALTTQLEQVKDSFQTAHAYLVIGRIYTDNLENHERAIVYYDSALHLLRLPILRQHPHYSQFAYLLPQTLVFKGEAQFKSGKASREAWESSFLEGISVCLSQLPNSPLEVDLRSNYAATLLEAKIPAAAFVQLQKVDSIALAHKVNYVNSLFLRRVSLAFEALGDEKNALLYLRKVEQFNERANKRNAEFSLLHEQVLQNERNNTIREQKNSLEQEAAFNRRILFFSISLGVALLFTVSLLFLLRKKNQLISKNALKLAKADEAKALLLSVIGHDLRSPFNTIFENLQLAHLLNPENKAISQSQQAAKGAFILLDSLMQWVSLQRDKSIEPKEERIEIAPLLERITEPLKAVALFKKFELSANLALHSLHSDSNALQIILRNLLLNALRYSLPDTPIELIADQLADGRLRLYVRNQAAFIPDDIAERLQASGKQLHQVALKGSGLGLHLVAEFAQKLGIQLQIIKESSQTLRCELIFAAGTQFEMKNIAPTRAAADRSAAAPLPKEVYDILPQLRQCALFESSRIQRLLEQLPAQINPPAQEWKEQILQAMYHIDESRWQALLNPQ